MGRRPLFTNNQVLEAIRRWMVRHGMAPTIEELRAALGAGSKRTILRYLDQLEEDGWIRRWPGARGMELARVPGAGIETVVVPILGQVPAGPLALAEESIEGYVQLPVEMAGPKKGTFFLLRVTGDSMNRAKVEGQTIEDGDLVLVRQQPSADNNNVVVVMIDGEATVKRLVRGPNYLLLRPESKNPVHKPVVLDRDAVAVGVVKAVLKTGSIIDGTSERSSLETN